MWFWFCLTLRKIAYHPTGVIYPQFGNHCARELFKPSEDPARLVASIKKLGKFWIGVFYV